MRNYLIILAFLCGPAFADALYEGPGLSVRLTDGNCPVEILKQLQEGTRGFFRSAIVVAAGQTMTACWAVDQDGDVFILDEAGDNGYIPGGEFRHIE